ncbi:PIN domain-containing protein [Longimicrobium sp.]|uniref:PIN domain-containing protein n=1 Tax=Longimicrobium sp. TaxID=2029185 RepID=UPI003B3BE2E9
MTVSAPIIAVYDANVLYPASLRDFLVRIARSGLVGARWSDRIHDEWIRNLLVNRPDLTAEQLERTRRLMDAAVPSAVVEGFERHVASLDLPDPDDRHVLAAAIEAKAHVIVTFNIKDFPPRAVARHGIQIRDPDAFVVELLARDSEALYAAVRAHRSALRKPPLTVDEYLEQLDRTGLKKTVAHLRQAGVAL